MDHQALWGLLLIAYVVPFWLWQISEHNTIEARKKLYPDRGDELAKERRFDVLSLVWGLGLVIALVAWYGNAKPIPIAIVLFGTLGVAIAIRAALKRWNLLNKPLWRYWFAASAVWCLGVFAWFLVFGRVSALRGGEFLLLAIVPPIIGAFALVAWRWARKGA